MQPVESAGKQITSTKPGASAGKCYQWQALENVGNEELTCDVNLV